MWKRIKWEDSVYHFKNYYTTTVIKAVILSWEQTHKPVKRDREVETDSVNVARGVSWRRRSNSVQDTQSFQQRCHSNWPSTVPPSPKHVDQKLAQKRSHSFPGGSVGKESACNAGHLGSIPGLGRSPGEGKGYPLQYSGLENSMDCIVHGVTKSRTQLSDFHFTSLH